MKTIYVTLSQFCEQDERPRQSLLEAGFCVLENKTGRRLKTEELYPCLKEADGVLAAVETYSADLLGSLPKLRCISRCGAGVDNIDLAAATNLQIEVLATRDEIVEPVAQMTVGMIFALLRNFPIHKNDFMEGLWKKHTGFLLSEKVIGLVGFGKIGRRVEEYLRPFAARVIVADPYLTKKDVPSPVELSDFDSLLQRADILSLHAARSPKEGYLIGKQEIAGMKPGSFLINTARGYLVDEKALEEGLESGHLAGAALDVFEQEPYQGRLGRYPHVLCTSHVATLTRASRTAMELKAAHNLVQFFKHREKNGNRG